MWKYLIVCFVGFSISGCASTDRLVPAPFATASDPEWIQSFDAGLREKQTQTVNSFGGRVEAKLALWEQLDCSRRVYVSQARAAQIKATETGAAVNDAMRQVTAEPMWILARNSCR